MVLILEVGAVQTTFKKNSTKRKKATSYHYPDVTLGDHIGPKKIIEKSSLSAK